MIAQLGIILRLVKLSCLIALRHQLAAYIVVIYCPGKKPDYRLY